MKPGPTPKVDLIGIAHDYHVRGLPAAAVGRLHGCSVRHVWRCLNRAMLLDHPSIGTIKRLIGIASR